MMKTINKPLLAVLFFLILFPYISCNKKQDKTHILNSYLKKYPKIKMGKADSYLVLTSKGCMGCIQKGINYLLENPQISQRFTIIIYSSNIKKYFKNVEALSGNLYFDSTNIIEKQNIGLTGFNIFLIKDGRIDSIKGLNTVNSASNFMLRDFFLNVKTQKELKKQVLSDQSQYIKSVNYPEFSVFLDTIVEQGVCKIRKNTLVFFTSDYCLPCKNMEPILDSIASFRNNYCFIKVNLSSGKNMLIAQQYGIIATPTIWILNPGEEVKSYIGQLTVKQIDSICR